MNTYHDLAYKIFRIGSFSYKTVFSCLVELPGNKSSKGTSLGKKNNTVTQDFRKTMVRML